MEMAMSMTGSAIDCYEDMFKEITKKLYGEDGLPDLSNNEKSSCANQQRITSMEFESENPILKPDEHLTAFGLAALMQNGFPTGGILNSGFQCHKSNPGILLGSVLEDKWVTSEESIHWTQSKIAMYNPSQKLFRCSECDCVGYLLRVAEHWLGTHSNVRAFHCPQCHYESGWARCVRIHLHRQHNITTDDSCDNLIKDNPVLQEIIKYLQKLKNKLEGNCTNKSSSTNDSFTPSQSNVNTSNSNVSLPPANSDLSSISSKRYRCTYCPYATDRRDLFTRHENIHREEKPFQCYVCQKQFNRADHVKKHFLRMHRDDPYDLNRIRRHPPKNASGMSYYQKYHSAPANELTALGALSIPGLPRNLSPNQRLQPEIKGAVKTASSSLGNGLSKSNKKKGERRFACCYCSWSGVDNWCLKRHMNTHLKPFVCALCDYKAARSERLATHILKVHNKRSCGKCSFLADDLTQLSIHQLEQHPLEQRNRTSNTNNVLRSNSLNGGSTVSSGQTPEYPTSSSLTACSQGQSSGTFSTAAAAAAALLQNSTQQFLQGSDVKSWNKEVVSKAHGAARLFNYLEASDGDGSEPATDSQTQTQPEQLEARPNLSQKLQSDFLEAGDVDKTDEDNGEETELPLFVCSLCGCEFEDDSSLETHQQYTHSRGTASPADHEESKENVDPDFKYRCRVCDIQFYTQRAIMLHMSQHSSLIPKPLTSEQHPKRSRKQIHPKKAQMPFWDLDEVEVLRHLNGKLKKWKCSLVTASRGNRKLVNKYIAQLVSRRRSVCSCCKNNGINRYHTRTCVALQQYWRHTKKRFKCEHCDLSFRHRYQTILHTSRVHSKTKKTQQEVTIEPQSQKQTENSNQSSSCPTSNTEQRTSLIPNSHSIYMPEAMSSAHKLAAGMPFFDHSFLHSSNTVNNHMPIIIPTFPPN